MFTDEAERRDLIFGVVLTAMVIGVVVWLRSQEIEQKAPVEPTFRVSPASGPATRVLPTMRSDEGRPVAGRLSQENESQDSESQVRK